MKKLSTAIITCAMIASAYASPAKAQTVRFSTSIYGGGEVIGESTTNINTNVVHETVDAGFSKEEMQNMAIAMVISGVVAMVAYQLTYRWYNK